MNGVASLGTAQGLDGRETAGRATREALNKLGTGKSALAICLATQELNLAEVVNGVSSLMGNTPLWGFSTTRILCADGSEQRHSVAVILIMGSELRVRTQWWPGYAQDSLATAWSLLESLQPDAETAQGLLMAADGINGNASQICTILARTGFPVAGALAAGDYSLGRTSQTTGSQTGSGGLATALLGGHFRVGVGTGSGWQDVGVAFKVTKTRGVWLQKLDGQPAAEAYSRVFGYPVNQWSAAPLADMARMYPLGIEVVAGSPEVTVRAPLHVEMDGSFRMNTVIAEGATAHLMVGDQARCLEAARQAAAQAAANLQGAKPLLALALADTAWQYLMVHHPAQFMTEIQSVMGGIPVVGAYTLGQVCRPQEEGTPQFLNNHLAVYVLGEGG